MNKKSKLYALAGVTAGALAVVGAASAHHAFSAEFDAEAPVLLRGEVTKVEWVNPHTWIHLAAEEEGSDETTAWMVEGGTPNTLLRNGLNKKSLQVGTPIIVRGYQSKDRLCAPACKANGRDITLSNGEKVFMGSSGTGAPNDGTDPRERRGPKTELPDVEPN
ncbi:DUF6152 family protein [Henriciella litoralis]|uniref:DUF6152 family protein n=1 Tax=Henriciella litoralis TaxID=568102 RepID=UPI000A0475C2|nr:DUF6152 family protein [Henriciella litoralis]